ncbi:hypothetical protein Tco_0620491 [Tanacetum coccineum]
MGLLRLDKWSFKIVFGTGACTFLPSNYRLALSFRDVELSEQLMSCPTRLYKTLFSPWGAAGLVERWKGRIIFRIAPILALAEGSKDFHRTFVRLQEGFWARVDDKEKM